jgi:hypothetical protein
MSTSFLDRLATQLKSNKSAACRRAIQRILDVVKKKSKMASTPANLRAKVTSGLWWKASKRASDSGD